MQTRKASIALAGLLAGGLIAASAGTSWADGDAPKITVAPIGHWHFFHEKSLSFKVTDASGKGLAKLSPVVEITRTGSDRVTVRTVKKDQIEDKGDGTYALPYTPSSIGGYAMVVKAAHDHDMAVSNPVVFEVARDGDEGVKASAKGTDYVYQIRYNWDPGHVHAHASNQVKLVFELMRGVQTGSEINWEKPWTNTFDHVSSAKDMTVRLAAKDGSVSEEIPGAYKGKGIYEATRVFTPSEVGHEKIYDVVVNFVDPANGARIKNPDAYPLRAVAGH